MAGFDDMLKLEDRRRHLTEALKDVQDEIAATSRLHLQYKKQVETLGGRIEKFRENMAQMKKAKVVLADGWAKTVRGLEAALEERLQAQAVAQKYAKMNKLSAESIPVLEAQLREVERELKEYGQILYFPGTEPAGSTTPNP